LINRLNFKKMIEARTNPGEATQKNETPNTITVTMILEDLDNGTDRNGIKDKYGLQAWEVKQMFEHPALKGKKARKVRKLSFNFVDDTVTDPNQTSIPVEAPDVDVYQEAMSTIAATPELQNVDGTMDDVREESQEVDDALTMYEDTDDFGDDEELEF
jgi:hypothetical protein